jgi:hypothetical protein
LPPKEPHCEVKIVTYYQLWVLIHNSNQFWAKDAISQVLCNHKLNFIEARLKAFNCDGFVVERFTSGMARVPMVYTKVADGFKNGGILKRIFGSK